MPRLTTVVLDQATVNQFIAEVQDITIQAIEYKPFLRFKVANILNEITNNSLGLYLQEILKDKFRGAILIDAGDEINDDVSNVLLSTAISHLVGLPNLDSMSSKFYARFTVKNTDDSDSYLRQHRRLELHTDGTYVDEKTDWVLMQKLASVNCVGGESLLLHIREWQEFNKFYNHLLSSEDIQWGSPASKNVSSKVYHPIFFKEKGHPCISYIDQFAEPQNMEQGLYLNDISESLEKDTNTIAIEVSVGSMLLINNLCWLHGRDKIKQHKDLSRELLRQRGVFF